MLKNERDLSIQSDVFHVFRLIFADQTLKQIAVATGLSPLQVKLIVRNTCAQLDTRDARGVADYFAGRLAWPRDINDGDSNRNDGTTVQLQTVLNIAPQAAEEKMCHRFDNGRSKQTYAASARQNGVADSLQAKSRQCKISNYKQLLWLLYVAIVPAAALAMLVVLIFGLDSAFKRASSLHRYQGVEAVNNRIEVAKAVAGHLLATEEAIDSALVSAAGLAGYMPQARQQARLSAAAGQQALEQVVASIAMLSEARRKIVEAHKSLAETGAQARVPPLNFGGFIDKGPLPSAYRLSVVADSQAG
jgi:hypothetical protein